MSEPRKQPVETLRDGNLKASVWENKRDENVMHSVQFRRSYRDQEGQYRDTDSFSGSDLLRLSKLAERSYEAIREHRSQTRKTPVNVIRIENDEHRRSVQGYCRAASARAPRRHGRPAGVVRQTDQDS